MSDARKFWREKVGVVPIESSRGGAARETAARIEQTEPSVQEPERTAVAVSSTGPVDTGTGSSGADSALAQKGLDLVGGLRPAPAAFASDVAQLLWPRPRTDDLERIARIARSRHQLGGSARTAVGLAVVVRVQHEQTNPAPGTRLIDSPALIAHAVTLTRLAQTAARASAVLDAAKLDAGPAAEAVAAARELIPDHHELLAFAELSRGIASTVEAVRSQPHSAAWLPIPEAQSLLRSVAAGPLRPDEQVYLEIYVACQRAAADTSRKTRAELLSDRRLIEVVDRRSRPSGTFSPDPDLLVRTASRRSAWRRLLADCRVRLDEELTRPVGASRVRNADEAEADAAIIAHLRAVREACISERKRVGGNLSPPPMEGARRQAAPRPNGSR